LIVEGKVIAISGVGRGLGRQIARLALRDGASVFLGARTPESLEAIGEELDPSGERVGWAALDIRERTRCADFAAAAAKRFGPVNALVNLAASDNAFGNLVDSEPDSWRDVFETNVIGSLQLTKEMLPHLQSAGGGAIIFIGAQAMYRPQTPQLAYAASKAALSTAMRYVAEEVGGRGIRVNTVVPTWMWGETVENYLEGMAAERALPMEQVVGEVTAGMPLGEIPGEADVAEAVIFLASERARMITGQSLLVNAGELYN